MMKVEGREALAGGECFTDVVQRRLEKDSKRCCFFPLNFDMTLPLNPKKANASDTAGSVLESITHSS